MPQTHILTRDKYIYSYIDIMSKESNQVNPPTQLAISKTIAVSRFTNTKPTIVKSDDTLVVHGTTLSYSQRNTLAKSFFFNGWALMCNKDGNWSSGFSYYYIGVNSEGDTVLCVPSKRGTSIIDTTVFKLPLKFDWSVYGVTVPNSALAKAESEVGELRQRLWELYKLKEQFSEQFFKGKEELQLEVNKFQLGVEKLKKYISEREQETQSSEALVMNFHKLQTKEDQVEEKAKQVEKLEKQVHEQKDELNKLQLLEEDYTKTKEMARQYMVLNQEKIATLEHQVQEKDAKIEKSVGKVEELKNQLNSLQLKLGKEEVENAELRQQVICLGQKVTTLENQVKSKDKWVLVNSNMDTEFN